MERARAKFVTKDGLRVRVNVHIPNPNEPFKTFSDIMSVYYRGSKI